MLMKFFDWLFGGHSHNWGAWSEYGQFIERDSDKRAPIGIVQVRTCINCGLKEDIF